MSDKHEKSDGTMEALPGEGWSIGEGPFGEALCRTARLIGIDGKDHQKAYFERILREELTREWMLQLQQGRQKKKDRYLKKDRYETDAFSHILEFYQKTKQLLKEDFDKREIRQAIKAVDNPDSASKPIMKIDNARDILEAFYSDPSSLGHLHKLFYSLLLVEEDLNFFLTIPAPVFAPSQVSIPQDEQLSLEEELARYRKLQVENFLEFCDPLSLELFLFLTRNTPFETAKKYFEKLLHTLSIARGKGRPKR